MSELNDPRVFFAAERTALAWNRTALTLMAFGFAIERFGLFMQMLVEKTAVNYHAGSSFWFGIVFISLAFFFSCAAAKQYKTILKTLKPTEIPAHTNPNLAYIVNIIIAALAGVLVLYLIVSNFL
jgi:putative membrane protein